MKTFLLFAALLLPGCATKLEVQSDQCWHGTVNANTVLGCGYATFSIRGASERECYAFTHDPGCGNDCGYLRVRLKGWNADGRWVEWSPQQPTVWVCLGR